MAGHIEVYDLPMFKPRHLPAIDAGDLPEMVEHYQDSRGQMRVKGGKRLKGSQAYPLAFLEQQSCCKPFLCTMPLSYLLIPIPSKLVNLYPWQKLLVPTNDPGLGDPLLDSERTMPKPSSTRRKRFSRKRWNRRSHVRAMSKSTRGFRPGLGQQT